MLVVKVDHLLQQAVRWNAEYVVWQCATLLEQYGVAKMPTLLVVKVRRLLLRCAVGLPSM
jgi:hypothetical protein